MELSIGFGRSPIPVPPGTPLVGYATESPRCSTGTHDSLFARALVLEQAGERFALVCCDLLSVEASMEQSFARQAAALGLDPAHFLLSATHTHSGPGGYTLEKAPAGSPFTFADPDPVISAAVERAVLDALTQAVACIEPCTLSTLTAPAPGVGTDRNHPQLPGDPTLTLLRFVTASGRTVLVYSTACHPTVLHKENTLVSADYPGVTSARLEAHGVDLALFYNGSAGDVSTRFTRTGSGFDEVTRLGALLADQVLERMPSLTEVRGDFPLTLDSMEVSLKIRRVDLAQQEAALAQALDRLEQARQHGADGGELRILQSRCEGAAVAVRYAQKQLPYDAIPVRVRFLHLGPLTLGFFPVELFSALSNPVRARFDQRFVPIGYTGNYLGYLTDPSVEHADSYEKYSTVYQFDQGVRLMAETTHYLEGYYGLSK